MRFAIGYGSILTAGLAMLSLAAAAPPTIDAYKAAIDAIANNAVAGGHCAGLAVDVDDAGVTGQMFYGKSGTARPLDGKTEFEIDSVTKTFTALVLALAVQRPDNPMQLDDPLQKYAPAGVTLPTYDGAPIRLVDLATHTAGLPRGLIGDPNQTPAAVWRRAATTTLASAPGDKYVYSNLGYGLLGLAEEDDQKKSLADIFTDEITSPLAMPDTRVALSADESARKAQGHHPNGKPAPADDTRDELGIAGAFALNSTPDDLLKYLALQMGDGPPALVAAARLAQTPVHTIGPKGKVGLAWNANSMNDGTPVIDKDGTGPGFTDYVAFTPSSEAGVVVMANQLSCGVQQVALRVLSVLNHGTAADAPAFGPDDAAQ